MVEKPKHFAEVIFGRSLEALPRLARGHVLIHVHPQQHPHRVQGLTKVLHRSLLARFA